ncbi:hypothetical protein ACSSS7_004008 [Eimeria intestinalis]
MDVDLALVSALQLRELLQQQLPSDEPPCLLLQIVKGGHELLDERTASDSGKKHRYASGSSSRRRKKDKDDVAHRAEDSHVAVQDSLETLLSDWPHADLLDTSPGAGAAPSSPPLLQSFSGGDAKAADAFAFTNSGAAAAGSGAGAASHGNTAVHRGRGADSRSKARGKGSRAAREAAQDASSSETSSSSASRSNVERVEEGSPLADGVGSLSNGGFQGEVTWEQRVIFFIKTSRKKSRRHRDSSSVASKAVHALQHQGQLRFLISCPGEKGPFLVGDLALHYTANSFVLILLLALVLQPDAELAARFEVARTENAALHHQNGELQAHIQQQQQVLMQQQHQLQALHAQVQQVNANLNDAFQRLSTYEVQYQQKLHTLHQVQQQRDAAAAHAAAEKAKLQREVLQLEDELEAAKEEEGRQQELARKQKKEADRLGRELQREVGRRRLAESKVAYQDKRIAELTTLLNNARSRIRHERQRTEELLTKLQAAAHNESSLKAELQASQ